jgi:hypothetical protein
MQSLTLLGRLFAWRVIDDESACLALGLAQREYIPAIAVPRGRHMVGEPLKRTAIRPISFTHVQGHWYGA